MMALVNNWDLKDDQQRRDGHHWRGMDSTASATSGRRSDAPATASRAARASLKDYAESRFIDKVTPTYVDFGMHSRPFFRLARQFPQLPLPHADGRASVKTHSDRRRPLDRRPAGTAFADTNRATASAPPDSRPADVDAYTQVVMQRIAALKTWAQRRRAAIAASCDRYPRWTAASQSTCRAGAASRDADRDSARDALCARARRRLRAGRGHRWRRASDLRPRDSRRGTSGGGAHFDATLPALRPGGVPAEHRRQPQPCRRVVQLSAARHRFLRHRAATPLEDLKTQFDIERRSYQGSLSRDLADHLAGAASTRS